MESVNNDKIGISAHQSNDNSGFILTPPVPLPFAINKNINLTKPPNILSPQQLSDSIASLPTNKLLSQALAKPPSLNLVLNKSISPSPLFQSNSNVSTPSQSFLTMPKNVLITNGQHQLINSPGSMLISQSSKTSEMTAVSTPASFLNSSSNASSKNSSTADLSQLVNHQTTMGNNQNAFSNSMPATSAAQFFSSLPAPLTLNKEPFIEQQKNNNISFNSTTQIIKPVELHTSNDLFTSNNNFQQQLPITAPIDQQTTSYFNQQPQSSASFNPQNNIANSQPTSSYLNQSNTSSSTPELSIIKQINQQQPTTAPISATPFFQPTNTNFFNTAQPTNNLFSNTINNIPFNSQNEQSAQSLPPPKLNGPTQTAVNNQQFIPNSTTTNNYNAEPPKTANYFHPPQQQNQVPSSLPNLTNFNNSVKSFNQPTAYFNATPTHTPPPIQQVNQTPQSSVHTAYYQPQPQVQPQSQIQQPLSTQQQTPYFFNPTASNQPPPGPPMPQQTTTTAQYSNKINSNFPLTVYPPPTATEIAAQQQQQQLPPRPQQQYPPSGFNPNASTKLLTNQMNNMNLSSSSSSTLNSTPSNSSQPPPSRQMSNTSGNSSSARQQYFTNRSQPQSVDLLREKRLIPEYPDSEEIVRPQFPHDFYTNVNCHHDTIRCTLTSIPESQTLLTKCRLPLGILIHPFKDLESLKVVQSSTIVRCRNCRSYINPFVHFLDNSKWRCNMCYSINDLPDEFLFDPVTRSYGDPSKRPEINSSTIEFIAPAEYTLRPPPPAMYLYLLDVSHNAVTTGYLHNFCETLLENLDKIPGDSRTQIGFITYNSSLHFYNLSDSLQQPRMMMYPDLEEVILPMPDNLMVNLNENRQSIQVFLQSLPSMFADSYETDSALGTALNAAYQLLKHTGGRITIMQTCLPNLGVGSLKPREENIDKDSLNLGPQTDFYKKMALDCAGVQIAVDLFMFNSLYADLATLSCVSKYSGGEIKYYPGFHSENHPEQVIRFCVDFKRYLIRKIGFEAVMRIRCTRGLAIHTFHGNFFVRSTDLLALPNVNPDAGFGMQVAIEENLTDITTVCFQAAVLYTSSKGERRIRIHTYCLPVSKNLNELINGADQEAIIGLVARMAVDRTTMSSLKEAKDALMNVAVDYLQAYSQLVVSSQRQNTLLSPVSLRLIPTYCLALLKNVAFKSGYVKMDDRVYAMNLHKTMPLKYMMLCVYPHLYAIHDLDDRKVIVDSSETEICIPPRRHLSSENIDRHGVYIMDAGEAIYMWIGRSVSDQFLQMVFDCKSFQELPDHSNDLPELDNILSERVRNFLVYLYDSRPFGPTFIYFREDSNKAQLFFQHMHDDKTESSISYYEFLRHLNEQISN